LSRRGRKRARPAAHPSAAADAEPPQRRRWLAGAAAALAVTAGVIGLARRGGPPALHSPTPGAAHGTGDNLLLITLDTTRADHLGAYGYARARTRHLDTLAAEGTRFENALSAAPITLPAHASMFTGLYPFEHGVRNNGNFYLGEGVPTLATVLKQQGYRTAAFVSSFILDRRYGLARGFDSYDDRMAGAQPQVIALGAERRGDHTSLALEAWLQQQSAAASPFFVWLHLYDPHEPYRPPRPFRDLFADAPYDGEIAFTDAIVAAVLDRLRALGQLDRTLVAVMADHGESLGEHGEETHTMLVYEPALRVPFILWRPGLVPAGTVVRQPVRGIDLAPTLLDLLGAPRLETPHARSLVPLLKGGQAGSAPPVYAETLLPQFYMNWAPLLSLRDDRWKLIQAPQPELYDLSADPLESRNLYGSEPERARALEAALRTLVGSGNAMNVGRLDREAMEKLAALGYVGAGAEPAGGGATSTVDPKTMISVFNRLRRANSAVRDRRFAEALPLVEDVLRGDPRNAFARLIMGSAHMGLGHYDEAIRWFKGYLELVPTSAYAHQWIAICHLQRGAREDALREAEAVLAIDPRFTDARVLRGGVLAARGDYAGAISELRAAVTTDPAKPMLRLDLAKVLAEAGRKQEARAEYEAALRAQPDFAPALVGLGVLQAGNGENGAAQATLTRALEVDPHSAEARFNLGRVLELRGDTAAAQAEYRRLAASEEAPPAIRAAARERLK
jgi:arylsulfatase A-like enzyme/tetratricopeptide (TPR) repeat protein